MRHLIALGLSLGVAVPALAQTEVIIRRPGEKDQVIHLDSTRNRAFSIQWDSNSFKWDSNLIRNQARVFQDQARTLQAQLSKMQLDSTFSQLSRIRLDSMDVQKLALRSRQAADEVKGAMAQMEREIVRARRQPHLGVVIETAPRASDNYGAYISAVTPGSPAEKAGIMAGDIITRIAGQSVLSKSARNDDRSEASPGLRLISLISGLKAGKEVEVDLRRGTQTRTIKVTPTEEDGEFAAVMAPSVTSIYRGDGNAVGVGLGDGEVMAPRARLTAMAPRAPMSPDMPMPAQAFAFGNAMGSGAFYLSATNSLFGNFELAPMNDKLGAYFGTSEGVLVVNTVAERQPFIVRGYASRGDSVSLMGKATAAPTRLRTDSFDNQGNRIYGANTLGLEPGDVIVSVDGRKVTTPSQLMRIVATYDHGDDFKLQIMRQKRAESVPVKMP
ncbi:MAG TPA: PDZ domain-containing protein [Gemmatimonadales bacterium]|jgi:hypothetical protein